LEVPSAQRIKFEVAKAIGSALSISAKKQFFFKEEG
jgi:hypothetical protein